MEKERPPDPENWDLDTSSTEDKINAYDAMASSYQAGIQPAIFLTHSFLQDHPILLEESLSDGELGSDSRPVPPRLTKY